ncbi:DUF3099 domain-containing protein [Streptomyces sp. NPDC020667]|uniref:DUF3099 domain-containing protein n=2 Tax=Streptomyces TaxID=1883 RepID=UPI0033D1A428
MRDMQVGTGVRRGAPVSYADRWRRNVEYVLDEWRVPAASRWWNVMRKLGGPEVIRITGARRGLAEDVRGRQRRYVFSMLVRTLSVVLTVVLWNVERYVAIGTLILGALLPYVAVVIANAGRENAPSLPGTFVPAPTRPVLMPPPVAGPAEPPAEADPGDGRPLSGDHGRDHN